MGKNATFNCTASLSGSDPSYFIAINGRIFPLESAEMSKQRFEIQSPSNKIRLLIIRNTTSDLNGTTLICKQCKKIFGIKVCQEDSIKMTVLKPRAGKQELFKLKHSTFNSYNFSLLSIEYDVITTSPLQPLTPINCSIQYIYSEKLIILTWQSLVEGEYKESSFFTYNVFKDNDTKAILSGRRNATVPIGLIYREYVSYPQGLESEASFTLYVRTVIGNVTSETCIERLVYTSEGTVYTVNNYILNAHDQLNQYMHRVFTTILTQFICYKCFTFYFNMSDLLILDEFIILLSIYYSKSQFDYKCTS